MSLFTHPLDISNMIENIKVHDAIQMFGVKCLFLFYFIYLFY